MSNTKSWINWIALIVMLLIFGVAVVLWPTISSSIDLFGGSSSVQVPVESQPIVINVPTITLPNGSTVGGQTFDLKAWEAIIALTAFTFGAILVTGLVITLVYAFLDKLRDKTVDSEEYKEHVTALDNKEKEYFREVRQGREAAGTPANPEMPRWAAWSTSIVILIFVALTGMVISLTFWPHWIEIDGNELLTPGLAVISVMCLITAIILIWRMGPQRIEKVEKSDNQGIPRDTIAIILTGLLILGLGIGFTIYINLP